MLQQNRGASGRFIGHHLNKKEMQELLTSNRRFDKATGCWLWVGGKPDPTTGYGRITVKGLQLTVHRIAAWIWLNIPLRTGRSVCVLHSCDVRLCFNPKHLFRGTLADNNRDATNKGRGYHQKRTHCFYGHPLDYHKNGKTSSGKNARCCLTCKRAREAARRQRLREERR